MPLIEQMNRLAETPITHLHKKSKHRERTSSDHSERESSDEGNSHRGVKHDFKAIARKVKKSVAHKLSVAFPDHSKRNIRSQSMIALSAYNTKLQHDLADDASDAEVHSSVYDSNSMDDSDTALPGQSPFHRQSMFDEFDDASQSLSSTSKATSAGSANIAHGPVLDARFRMRDAKKLKTGNQVQTLSEHSKASPLRVQSESRSSRHANANTSIITEVIPREGYFWQILLYIRLARALPAQNFNGKVDAYVKLKHRGETLLRTSTIRNNRSPVWDQKFQFPINNLNYPLELRVYHRDPFKKNAYIGRVMVYPATLTFGQDEEFSVALSDEAERNLMQSLGELNFWITLGEIECTRVPSERRRKMLKQMRADQQVWDHLTPLPMLSPSEISQIKSNQVKPVTNRPHLSQLRLESFDYSSLEMSRESTAELAITPTMDEYEPDFDEWLLPSATYFYQPQWPLAFYDGTNIEVYTANVADKTQYVSIPNMISAQFRRNNVPLETSFNRARLVVNLIRAENLSLPISSGTSSNARNSDPMSKLITGHGMERAVMGLPINHTDGSLPSFVATLSVGKSLHNSRAVRSPDSPCWHQLFEFHLKLGKNAVLNVEITDQAVAVPMILFRGHLDFKRQVPDWTNCFTLKNTLEGHGGHVILLATLTGLTYRSDSASDESPIPLREVNEEPRNIGEFTHDSTPFTPKLKLPSKELLSMVESHYSLRRTLENKNDVGWLYLVVRSARELATTGRSGQPDPYCYLHLVNRYVHTATIYKTTSPTWNQAFVFPISDIYDVLEIGVVHNGKHDSELLGRLNFPVIQLANHRGKWYILKDKKLRKLTRGAIRLESFVIYNPIRAAMRVFYPQEKPLVWVTSRIHLRDLIRKYVPDLQQNIDRVTPYGVYLTRGIKMLKRLYYWENPFHSSLFLAGTWVVITFVQPYMIFGGLFLGFAAFRILTLDWVKNQTRHRLSLFTNTEGEEDDFEEYVITDDILEDDSNSESDELVPTPKPCHKRRLKAKLAKAREVLETLQTFVDSVASTAERIDCLLRWQVPWLSLLFFLYLVFNTLLAYFVPVRYLLLFYVTKLFTNRLSNFKYIDFSAMSIISRVPNKLQRIGYREHHPKGTL